MTSYTDEDFPLSKETYAIIGAAIEVHKELGSGFLEAVYQEALEYEFKLQGIPYIREKKLNIKYKGQPLLKHYSADFICYGEVIVELKALSSLTSDHDAQVLNYLKATGKKVALLINFGARGCKYKRLISPF